MVINRAISYRLKKPLHRLKKSHHRLKKSRHRLKKSRLSTQQNERCLKVRTYQINISLLPSLSSYMATH